MLYQLKRKQIIHTDMDTCWEFFSRPENLKNITPPSMGFEVLTEVPGKMYSGMFIAYIVRPLLGIPMRWVTEITHIEDKVFFVDEQRMGPYRIWHHEHHFKKVENGVEMIDIVSYSIPYGWIGRIANSLFIRKKIEGIFDYRFEVVERYFS